MKTAKPLMLVLILLATSAALMTLQKANANPMGIIQNAATFTSCDAGGTEKHVFQIGESVYCKGGTFNKNHEVSIYVIPNGKMPNPTNAVSGPENATTDSGGHLPVTLIWEPAQKIGEFDVYVDTDMDGKLDWTDRVYYFSCCNLFLVVPDQFLGSIGAIAAMACAFGVFRLRKSKPSPALSKT